MLTLYYCLLYFYPREYRRCFGQEMFWVFSTAHDGLSANLRARIGFCFREVRGLLWGAMREHIRGITGPTNSVRRFEMRPEFHFPRSTVFLMLVIFAGVVLTIVKATSVELAYGGRVTRHPDIRRARPTCRE